MSRPPLAIGTYGDIWVSDAGQPYKARVRYRDKDGVVRTVARFGQTKAAAKAALRAALADRQHHGTGSGVTAESTVATLAGEWLTEVGADAKKAVQTKELYRYAVDRYVLPHLGAIRLREARTGLVDQVLGRVTELHGPAAARTTRAVLNGMFGVAVRHGALTVSPVRETRPISSEAKPSRALTVAEVDRLTTALRTDERAGLLDLPDLVDWMLGTGCRIGEALAIREGVNADGNPLLDLEAGTVEINATAVRVKGVGMIVQERPKTAAGWRILALPPYAVAMLERRASELRFHSPAGVVFGSPLARSIRDPSNTSADLRRAVDGIDCAACSGTGLLEQDGKLVRCGLGPFAWVTSHTFRKTVATRMDEAGCSAREIADQLGHAQPSMTLDVYMGRRVVSAKAAAVLER